MQYLFRGLRTEWLKTNRTFIVWYVILCPFLLATLIFVVFWARRIEIHSEKAFPDINFWQNLLMSAYVALTNLFLVLFIVLLNTMLYAREHQGNMWKHLYSLPVPRWSVFGAKSLFAVLLLAFSICCYFVFINITAYSLDFVKPIYKFSSHDSDFTAHLLLAFRIFVSALGVWAIHNWLSLRFKGMGLSMGIAIISIVVTPFMVVGKEQIGNWIYFYPYVYPFEVVSDFMEKDKNMLANFWQPETYGSLIVVIVFTLLGYWEYNRNRHK